MYTFYDACIKKLKSIKNTIARRRPVVLFEQFHFYCCIVMIFLSVVDEFRIYIYIYMLCFFGRCFARLKITSVNRDRTAWARSFSWFFVTLLLLFFFSRFISYSFFFMLVRFYTGVYLSLLFCCLLCWSRMCEMAKRVRTLSATYTWTPTKYIHTPFRYTMIL